jgi:hypothetical protein
MGRTDGRGSRDWSRRVDCSDQVALRARSCGRSGLSCWTRGALFRGSAGCLARDARLALALLFKLKVCGRGGLAGRAWPGSESQREAFCCGRPVVMPSPGLRWPESDSKLAVSGLGIAFPCQWHVPSNARLCAPTLAICCRSSHMWECSRGAFFVVRDVERGRL